jgi:hypothetical protein
LFANQPSRRADLEQLESATFCHRLKRRNHEFDQISRCNQREFKNDVDFPATGERSTNIYFIAQQQEG